MSASSPTSRLWQAALTRLRRTALRHRQRLVVSAGMPRSGSTLIYNILRQLLEHNRQHYWAGNLSDYRPADHRDCRWILVKTHVVKPDMLLSAAAMFYSYRDLRDSLVSAIRKFDKVVDIQTCRDWVWEDVKANWFASQTFQFEAFTRDLPGTIFALSKGLGLGAAARDVSTIAQRLPSPYYDPSNNGYDSTTLMHGGHATHTQQGEWRQLLPPGLLHRLDAEMGWWFRSRGYPPTVPERYRQSPRR